MKLLDFAVVRGADPFSASDATTALNEVTETDFNNFIDIIYAKKPDNGTPKYAALVDVLPKYIQFREFEEAQISARDAKKEARTAKTLAFLAMALAIVLAVIQIAFQVKGDVKINDGQLRQLVTAPQTIEKAETTGLDEIKKQLEDTNKALQQINQNESEILKLERERSKRHGRTM